jgi:hypothetical protein
VGLDPPRVITVQTACEKDLLWAAEEAASNSALAAVVARLGRREKLYGFTPSRRLKLRHEKSGVPVFVVRHRPGDATAAQLRWRVSAAASAGIAVPGSCLPLLGQARFAVTLERCPGVSPRTFEVEFDATQIVCVAAPLSDRPAEGQARRRDAV